MGEFTDKAKGLGNQVSGSIKKESADPDVRAEGQMQDAKGQVQNLKGKVEGALGDKV